MKVFLCICLFAIIAGLGAGNPTVPNPSNVHAEPEFKDHESFPRVQLGSDLNRYRKSYGSGGGHSMPSPACPKNYMFGCQPHLSHVPCASSSGASYSSHGSSGAYTAPVPAYIAPIGFTFNEFVPQINQNW